MKEYTNVEMDFHEDGKLKQNDYVPERVREMCPHTFSINKLRLNNRTRLNDRILRDNHNTIAYIVVIKISVRFSRFRFND